MREVCCAKISSAPLDSDDVSELLHLPIDGIGCVCVMSLHSLGAGRSEAGVYIFDFISVLREV